MLQQVILSDGAYYLPGVLAPEFHPLVHKAVIEVNCVVKINEFVINQLESGRKLVIL